MSGTLLTNYGISFVILMQQLTFYLGQPPKLGHYSTFEVKIVVIQFEWDKFKWDTEKVMLMKEQSKTYVWKWKVGRFVFVGMVVHIDGWLCRIPNPVARRFVSGFIIYPYK